MAIFAATPAQIDVDSRHRDPGHTREGFTRMAAMRRKLKKTLPPGKYLVAEGSGLQFHQVAVCIPLELEPAIQIGSRIVCPALGGPEAIDEATNMIILASGDTVPRAQFLALTDTKGFSPLIFLNDLWGIAAKNGCQHVFLATSCAFISALLSTAKIKAIKLKPGVVYQLTALPGTVMHGSVLRIA